MVVVSGGWVSVSVEFSSFGLSVVKLESASVVSSTDVSSTFVV